MRNFLHQICAVLCLLLTGTAATYADTTYKSDFTDGDVVALTQTNCSTYVEEGWVSVAGETSGSASATTFDDGTSFSKDTYYKVKQAKSRYVILYVKGITGLTCYFKNAGDDDRTAQYTTDMSVTDNSKCTSLVTVSAKNTASGEISDLDSGTEYAIKICASGDIYFYGFKVSVDATTKTETTLTLDQTELTLDPEATATLAATLTAGDETLTGKTITWTSSNTNVATVEDGMVTAVAGGTATITATFAGDDDYQKATATCSVTVNSTDQSDVELTAETDKLWNFSDWTAQTYSTTTVFDNMKIWATSDKTVVIDSNSKTIDGTKYTQRMKTGGKASFSNDAPVYRIIQIKVQGPVRITAGLTSASSSEGRTATVETYDAETPTRTPLGTLTAAAGTVAAETVDYTGTEETLINIYSSDGGVNFYFVKVEPIKTESVDITIGQRGYISYNNPDYALDFTQVDGLKAYYASDFVWTDAANNVGKVVCTELTAAVPAKTGVILAGTANTTYTVPVVSEAQEVSGNLLTAVTDEDYTTVESDFYFGYNKTSGVGFYTYAGKVVSVGKAYISADDLPVASDKSDDETEFDIDPAKLYLPAVGNGSTTGIGQMESAENEDATLLYNMMGQKVNAAYRGVVIKNGKKYVNK